MFKGHIDNWCLFGHCITGHHLQKKKAIKTSVIIARNDKTVTTKSGSEYMLMEPAPVMKDESHLARNYDNAKDPWEAIDNTIKISEAQEADNDVRASEPDHL